MFLLYSGLAQACLKYLSNITIISITTCFVCSSSPCADTTNISIPAYDSEQQIELIIPLLEPTKCRAQVCSVSQHLLNSNHFPYKGDKRRECVVCSDPEGGERRVTYYTCDKCPNKPALCVEPCFKKYHIQRPSLYGQSASDK